MMQIDVLTMVTEMLEKFNFLLVLPLQFLHEHDVVHGNDDVVVHVDLLCHVHFALMHDHRQALVELKMLTELVGQIKCAQSIALADCYSIATGRMLDCPILFKEEAELDEPTIESVNGRFGTKILILHDT
jgi:hypothetical protein